MRRFFLILYLLAFRESYFHARLSIYLQVVTSFSDTVFPPNGADDQHPISAKLPMLVPRPFFSYHL